MKPLLLYVLSGTRFDRGAACQRTLEWTLPINDAASWRLDDLVQALVSCSFCGVQQFKTRKLISVPWQTWICDGCVTLGRRLLESSAAQADERARLEPADPDVRCHFCGQGARRTGGRLVTGRGRNICASCLDLCDEILIEDH